MDVWRRLPSVDEVLRGVAAPLLEAHPRALVREAVREAIARRREHLKDAPADEARITLSMDEVRTAMERVDAPVLRRVINATGVVLHTNLGRAPLGEHVLARVVECARGYTNLEYDLAQRGRGSRSAAYAERLARLTGAEAALAVNNNAAAMLLALTALAQGGEVIVSRGELVEIGGAFRVPDVLAASGARLREVGTTNKTRVGDYEAAIGPDTRALLKVHRSNFAVVGFTEEPSHEALVELGRARGVPVLYDLGSGALVDLSAVGVAGETTAPAAVQAGYDLVCFSGDKLMGGPQAGLIVGKRAHVERLAKHPMFRAMRLDRLRLAALEETLRAYSLGPYAARQRIPTLEMLTADDATVSTRARDLQRRVRRATAGHGFVVRVVRGEHSTPGGGSSPLSKLPTHAVSLRHPRLSAEALEALLRASSPPILTRIADGAVLFDPRTLLPDEPPLIAAAVGRLEVPL